MTMSLLLVEHAQEDLEKVRDTSGAVRDGIIDRMQSVLECLLPAAIENDLVKAREQGRLDALLEMSKDIHEKTDAIFNERRSKFDRPLEVPEIVPSKKVARIQI